MQRNLSCLVLVFIVTITFVSITQLSAADISWTNKNGGYWTDAKNWRPNQVPNHADSVRIEVQGTYAVTLDISASLSAHLTIGSGCTFLVTTNGILALSGSGVKNLEGTIINAGNIILDESVWIHMKGPPDGSGREGKLVNLANGLVEMRSDVSINGYLPWGIHNLGHWRKSGGSETSSISVPFTNTGTVDVNSGTLRVENGGSNSGILNTAVGTILEFATSYTFNEGSQLTGMGTNLWTGGTITLNGSVAHSNSVLDGPVSLVGTGTISGAVSWLRGKIGAGSTLTIATNGILALSGSSVKNLEGTIINAGNIILDESVWIHMKGPPDGSGRQGKLVNLANGLVEMRSDVSINGYLPWGIHNLGHWRKSGGSETSSISVPFTNTGTVDVNSGTLRVESGGSNSGILNTAVGTILEFATSYTFNEGSQLTGMGTNLWTGGTITLNGSVAHSNSVLDGPVSLVGTGTISGAVSWLRGKIGAGSTLTIATNGILALSGSSVKNLEGIITNAGTITLDGTGWVHMDGTKGGGMLMNLADAVVDMQSDLPINGNLPLGIHNQGLWRKSGGSGTSNISVPFINTGTLDVQMGIVRLSEGHTLPEGTINFGISGPALNGRLEFQRLGILGGTVGVNLRNAYVPAQGSIFQLVSGNPLTSRFTMVNFPADVVWHSHYTSSAYTLEVGAPLTTPRLQLSTHSASTLSFNWSGAGFHLERTLDLTNPEWTAVANGNSPPVNLPTVQMKEFFRLAK